MHQTTATTYEKGKYRTMTLVFAKEKSEEAIKEALFAGRTLAIFQGYIAGREDYLKSLIRASLDIRVINEKKGVLEITNPSDLQYILKWGDIGFSLLRPNTTTRLTVNKGTEIVFDNCITGEQDRLKMPIW